MEKNMEKSPNIFPTQPPVVYDFKLEDKKKARKVLLNLLRKAA